MHPIDEVRFGFGLILMFAMVIAGLSELLPNVHLMASDSVVIPPIESAASSPWLIPIVIAGAILLPLTSWLDQGNASKEKQ